MFRETTDEQLCLLARQGSRDAEQELVIRYMRFVRACARPFFLVGGDSEDVIQEGMIGLISAIREFDEARESGFQIFAGRCIRNRILSAVKSASRKKHAPLSEYVPLELQSSYFYPPNTPQSPEEVVLSQESFLELFSALQGLLSPLEQQVFGYYLEGMSYQEISVELNIPSKSVDNAVQRIRRKLSGLNPRR